MEPLSKNDLISQVAKRAGLDGDQVAKTLYALSETVTENMHRGACLPGIGEIRCIQGRDAYSNDQEDRPERNITVVFPDSAFDDKISWNVAAAELLDWLNENVKPAKALDEFHLEIRNRIPARGELDEDDNPQFKVGGDPDWIDAPDVPRCCNTAMTFYAQLDTSFPSELNFWDCAMIYVFLCTNCGSHTTKMQSY